MSSPIISQLAFLLRNNNSAEFFEVFEKKKVHRKQSLNFLLFHAVDNGNIVMADFLIQKGADPNAVHIEGDFVVTPLYYACTNLNMVQFLVEKGADMHRNTDDMALSFVMKAISEIELEVAEYFLQNEVEKGHSILFDAFHMIYDGYGFEYCVDVIRLLLKYDVEINEFDEEDRTLLCCVCSLISPCEDDFNLKKELIQFLLDNGADPNLSNPLDYCREPEECYILLTAGATFEFMLCEWPFYELLYCFEKKDPSLMFLLN